MLSKKEIKDIQSLHHKKNRDEAKLFVAEGPKIVNELLPLLQDRVVQVLATGEWASEQTQVPHLRIISEAELQKVSFLQTPNQVVAVFKQEPMMIPEQLNGFCLYLDTIQDPGNLGTIIRIADWFGVSQVVCSEGCADVYNPKVVQSTMASIARVSVYYDKDEAWLKSRTEPIYAATLQGQPLLQFQKENKGILIIGNESKGIRNEILQFATHLLTIPRKGQAESLNAAVATGIILAHLLS